MPNLIILRVEIPEISTESTQLSFVVPNAPIHQSNQTMFTWDDINADENSTYKEDTFYELFTIR